MIFCCMKLTTRRLIYSTFIFSFLVAAPIIVLYSSGFHFDLKRQSFQRKGVLFVESFPEDATIAINGKEHEELTPTHVPDLDANDYEVTVSKEGYFPWSNRLPIYENQTTFIQSIQLFLQDSLPATLADLDPDDNPVASDNGAYLAWAGLETLNVYDTDRATLERYSNADIFGDEDIIWSPDNKHIAVVDDVFVHIYTRTGTLAHAMPFFDSNSLLFDSRDSDIVYVVSPQSITRVHVITKNTSEVVKHPQIVTAYPAERGMYYVDNFLDTSRVVFAPFAPQESSVTLAELPAHDAYQFVSVDEELVVLHNTERSILLLIRPLAGSVVREAEVLDGVTHAEWSPDGEKLLVAGSNDVRVHVFPAGDRTKKGSTEILARLSTAIADTQWYSDSSHIFYATEAGLFATELFRAQQRNTWHLSPLSDELDLYPLSNKKELVFKALLSGKLHLYALELQK